MVNNYTDEFIDKILLLIALDALDNMSPEEKERAIKKALKEFFEGEEENGNT